MPFYRQLSHLIIIGRPAATTTCSHAVCCGNCYVELVPGVSRVQGYTVMMARLHKLACTTPAIRADIHASNESCAMLAKRYGISPMAVLKWRRRTGFEDHPHIPQRLPSVSHPRRRQCGARVQGAAVGAIPLAGGGA